MIQSFTNTLSADELIDFLPVFQPADIIQHIKEPCSFCTTDTSLKSLINSIKGFGQLKHLLLCLCLVFTLSFNLNAITRLLHDHSVTPPIGTTAKLISATLALNP